MSENTEKNNAYDKLTPQRKALVDMVLKNLENGKGIWEQGWAETGVPVSAATGKRYRGINNLFLSLIAIERGYIIVKLRGNEAYRRRLAGRA